VIELIIKGIIGFLVPTILGFLIGKLKIKASEGKSILKEFEKIKVNELMDMKSDLSNKFFIYDALDEVEDYLVISFQEKCERYFELGGNTYIHQLYEKSKKWKIKHTGYLK